MILDFILMFIPSAISLGLVTAYMLIVGVPIGRVILILVIIAFVMSLAMAKIITQSYAEEEEDDE